MNETLVSAPPTLVFPPWFLFILWVIIILLSLVTTFGNMLVVTSFHLESQIRQLSNYFIASLAISDLIIGLEGFPILTIYVMYGQRWVLGRAVCELWLWLDYSLCLVSILTVLLITVDRYYSVVYPTKYRQWQSLQRVQLFIVISWALPTALFGLLIFGWSAFGGESDADETTCYAPFLTNPYVNMALYLTYYWTVLVAIIILYRGIHRVALDLEERGKARERQSIAIMSTHLRMAQVSAGLAIGDQLSSWSNSSKSSPPPPESEHLMKKDVTKHHSSHPVHYGATHEEPHLMVTSATNDNLASISSVAETSFASSKEDTNHLQAPKSQMKSKKEQGLANQASERALKKLLDETEESSYADVEDSISQGRNSAPDLSPRLSWISIIANPSQLLKRKRKKTKAEKRARKAFRTITVIVGAFALFWSPYFIVATIYAFKSAWIPDALFLVSYYMCYLNSTVNPVCYALANRHFRSVFLRILRGDFRSK